MYLSIATFFPSDRCVLYWFLASAWLIPFGLPLQLEQYNFAAKPFFSCASVSLLVSFRCVFIDHLLHQLKPVAEADRDLLERSKTLFRIQQIDSAWKQNNFNLALRLLKSTRSVRKTTGLMLFDPSFLFCFIFFKIGSYFFDYL